MRFYTALVTLLVSTNALALPVDPWIGTKLNVTTVSIPKEILNEILPIGGPGGLRPDIDSSYQTGPLPTNDAVKQVSHSGSGEVVAHAKHKRGGGWQASVLIIGEIGMGAFLGWGVKELTDEVQKKNEKDG